MDEDPIQGKVRFVVICVLLVGSFYRNCVELWLCGLPVALSVILFMKALFGMNK